MNQRGKGSFLILIAAALTTIIRSPLLLLHGRVWAEEGTVYYQQAWDTHVMDALLAVHVGYYSLFMNGLTLIAEKCAPPELLALILTWAAFAALMLTVYLAIECEAFRDARSRWLAAGIVVLTPAIEVWLTAEDVQFYLVVCVALIWISDETRHRVLRSVTLLLGGLTGPVSCILTPFLCSRLSETYRRSNCAGWHTGGLFYGTGRDHTSFVARWYTPSEHSHEL